MKKFSQKLLVLVIAIMTIMSMSAVSFADKGVSTGSTIAIQKSMNVKSPSLSSVSGPGASYSYAIAGVTPSADNGGTTVSDAQNHSAPVSAGPSGGVSLTSNTVAWPTSEDVNASTAGTANTKSLTATADVSAFSAPGVYRYSVTQTKPSDLAAIGVTDNSVDTLFLDVYIKKAATGEGFEVGGYVLHDAGGHKVDGYDEKWDPTAGEPDPDTGVKPGALVPSPAEFETVDVTLTKAVAGAMADKNHAFPFTITVADTSGRKFATQVGSGTDTLATGATASASLKDRETVTVKGLSKVATVAYEETELAGYTPSYSIAGGTAVQAASMPATAVITATAVTFTNTLEEVSPTGVVMNFLPYILMIAVATIAFMVFKKTKTNK